MKIKDTMRTNGMSGIKIPQIKGHVKIRLYNPNTWKQEIIEGDNMITNALRDIFASNLCGAMKYNDMLPLYSKMLGGVICFGETLDISSQGAADDYFIPDNHANTVIAHAGQTPLTSQADDITRGNPSDTRMAVADGAVTMAWEWASTAGNGLIKSLGLTHTDVGDAGTGSTSDVFKAMTTNINADYGIAPSKIVHFVDSKGYGYTMAVSGTSLTLTKFPMAYSEVGLVGMPFNFVSGIEKTKTITLGTSFGGAPMYFFDKASSKLYFFYNESLSNSVSVDIVNLSDWDNIPSPTHATWSNLGESVGPLNTTIGRFCNLAFDGVYVYLPKFTAIAGNTTGFLKVKLSSTGDQTFVGIPSGEASGKMLSGAFIPNADHRIIAGKSYVINNNVLFRTSIANPDIVYTWAGDNKTVNSNLDQSESLVGLTCATSGGAAYPSISKFYLASKFNLPTPVQKTNTQSMVVTYTLTEVSGNE